MDERKDSSPLAYSHNVNKANRSLRQATETPAESPLPNPIDISVPPIGKYKFFDMWYQGQDDLRVISLPEKPNTLYAYSGDDVFARFRLSSDGKQVLKTELAAQVPQITQALAANSDFPFTQHLVNAIRLLRQPIPEQENIVRPEFSPSEEAIQIFHSLFVETFQSKNIVMVPATLIRRLLSEQPGAHAEGLYIPQTINGKLNPMLDEYHNTILGWALGNGIEYQAALKLASEIVNQGRIMLAIEGHDEISSLGKKELAFHELLHKFFAFSKQSKNIEVKAFAQKMFDMYSSIKLDERLDVEGFFSRLKYSTRQRPEEFWTHYLTLLNFPTTDIAGPLTALLELGNNTGIQAVINKLPFIINADEVHQLIDKVLSEGETVTAKE